MLQKPEGFRAKAPRAKPQWATEAGSASERILQHVATGTSDILVMGSRGLGLIQVALIGSISRKVLPECRIPVFIENIEHRT
jgi:nucleotide-binding universal stress UspA family protein